MLLTKLAHMADDSVGSAGGRKNPLVMSGDVADVADIDDDDDDADDDIRLVSEPFFLKLCSFSTKKWMSSEVIPFSCKRLFSWS